MTGTEGALSPNTDPSPHFRKMGESKSPHPISRSGETEAEDKEDKGHYMVTCHICVLCGTSMNPCHMGVCL